MKAIIFDLDGTLLDSLEEIALSMNTILKEFNYPVYEINEYKRFVGDGPLSLVKRVLPANTKEEIIQTITQALRDKYDKQVNHSSRPYEGIYNLLESLKTNPIKLAILSNKPHDLTCRYIKSLFSQYEFLEVHGQKMDVPKKPHPQGALHIAKKLNIDPEEIYFIGDTPTDMNTAKHAKMKSIGVAWGFRPKEELLEAGANYIVEDCEDFWRFIQERV